jgi:hypothetical protein
MRSITRVGLILLTFGLTSTVATAEPATQPAPSATTQPAIRLPATAADFMRFVDHGSTGSRLETADVAYRNADGVTVHLVAAVHIGEREYYDGLSQSFRLRDAVLYEMVKPKDKPLPAPGSGVRSDSAVSQFQRMLKDTLNLEFQLDCIDYTQPNFIHADLDAETFQRLQSERGESMMTLMLKQMMQQMSRARSDATDEDLDKQLQDLVRVFTRPDSTRQLKFLLAKNLAQMEESGTGFDALGGTVILTDRNNAAITTLQTALKDGKRDIAIFYGAAHMPELSKHLVEMGFSPIATQWRMAWDLTIRNDQPSAVEDLLMDLIKGMKDDNN